MRLHRMTPLLAETQINSSFLGPASNDVRKTRSPQTTGDECPTGKAVFQAGAPNFTGGVASDAAMPAPLGPRNAANRQSATKVNKARACRIVPYAPNWRR